MAPEVVKRLAYDGKADVWSMGVLLYEMLHGHEPFRVLLTLTLRQGGRDNETMQQILEDDIVFDQDVGVAQDARDLIQKMLRRDPRQRPSVIEVLDEPWVRRMQFAFNISDRLLSREADNRTLSTEASHADVALDSLSLSTKPPTPPKSGMEREEEEVKSPAQVANMFDEIPRDVLYGYPAFVPNPEPEKS